MPTLQHEHLRFGFGKNWQQFVPTVDETRIARARESVTSFLELSSLEGKAFLDIGSGSGLFSYAAFLLGAAQIVSFDYDANSVAATTVLWEKAGKPEHWQVLQGSALDESFLKGLGTFDIVYSWGVLHHTGRMWDAIAATANMTKAGGLYCIALYNNVEGRFGSRFWLRVKERYNKSGKVGRNAIERLYGLVYFVLAPLLRGKNPRSFMRAYGAERGMDYRRDIADWVGGYPYEYASTGEVFAFMKEHFPAFQLTNLKSVGSIGNNWFLFKHLEHKP